MKKPKPSQVKTPKAKPLPRNKMTEKAQAAPEQAVPANAIVDAKGKVAKLVFSDDPIARAVTEAIQETVSHPTGDVNDAGYIPNWVEGIANRVASKLGVKVQFVWVSFHNTDSLGVSLDDDNWVRIMVRVGDERRHTLLVDPTPED